MNIKKSLTFIATALLFLLGPVIGICSGRTAIDTLIITGGGEYPIHSYTGYYADSIGLPVKSIIAKADSGLFTPMRGKPLNAGFTNNYYWTKTCLHNTSSKPVRLMWLFMNPAINEVELIKVQGDSITSLGKSGDRYPFWHRPYYFNLVTYPITLQPGERADFYTYLDKKGENFKAAFRLAEEDTFALFAFREYFVIGMLIGTMVLVMLFNIFLLFSLKDNVHGWYSLYVVAAILMMLAFEEMDFQFIYPNFPQLCDLSRLTTCGLSLFMMIIVMRKFYSLSRTNSRLYSWVVFMQWFTLLYTLSNILVYKFFPSFGLKKIYLSGFSIMTISSILTIVLTSIEKVRQGFKPAYFYLFALSFIFFGAIAYLISLFGFTSTFSTSLNGIQMGVVFETVVISFGILYRYNLFKREKERLAFELEINKTQTTLQLIATQEAERKRIAEDLHDALGGNLASIKMNIQNMAPGNTQLSTVVGLLDKASEDVRSISHNLMPPEFSETNLKDLLANYYNQLNNRGSVRFNFHTSGIDRRFNKIDELMINRIVSELTNNILKHSHATEATIQLIYYEEYLEIMAEDNGVGIAPQISDGIGLKNIQSRVNYLGGKINIHSNSFGTTIIAMVNYKK